MTAQAEPTAEEHEAFARQLLRENRDLRAKIAAVRALADRWAREAVERGPGDEIYTDGVAAMLLAVLDGAA